MLKQLKKDLKILEIRFEGAGGRGPEEADEIDAHRAAVEILKGEDWECHTCKSEVIPTLATEKEREALAREVLTQMGDCETFHGEEEEEDLEG